MKKLLVVGVIVLFLGLAIAPSINANVSKASIDSELVEITTEAYGINGVTPNTVSLSKEDAEEVEKLIDDIERRLDEVETREETVEIFNEAVVELDKYGLLGGLSVKQAQKLVTGGYQNRRAMKVLEKLYNRNQELYDDNVNYLCLVCGRATYTARLGFVGSGLLTILYVVHTSHWFQYLLINTEFFGLLLMLFLILVSLNPVPYICPLAIGGLLGFGLMVKDFQGAGHLIPSEGFITSFGLLGIKQWSGKFRGQGEYISGQLLQMLAGLSWWSATSPIGAVGFTGIKIMLEFENSDTFFLGSALQVNIE